MSASLQLRRRSFMQAIDFHCSNVDQWRCVDLLVLIIVIHLPPQLYCSS